jgi:Flp pilus assembly protein TadG
MPASRIATRLIALTFRFLDDSQANLAVIFAIALLPLLAAVGCATEYSLATRMKAKMQAAADAASVASISRSSPGYLSATKMTTDGPVSAGVADANNVFNGNLGTTGGYGNLSVTSAVTKVGSILISNVQFNAEVPTAFMKIVGSPSLTISGSSTASGGIQTAGNVFVVDQRGHAFSVPNGMFNQRIMVFNQRSIKFNPAPTTARIAR